MVGGILALVASLWSAQAFGEESGIAIVMAPNAVPGHVNRDELALIFKRKKRYWESGERVQPVNLPATHLLRRAFTMQVYNHTPEELEDYWRDQYFQGVLPPYVLASEEAVIRLVSTTPGAIGYVSACSTDHRVVVVLRLEGGPACGH